MGNYIQIEFQNISPSQSEILVAELSQINFEGFEENENSLRAFVNEKDFDEAALNEITTHQNLNFLKSNIEETNWNQVWESNFQPVSIEDFVTIRAAFHEPVKNTEHEIIITPKMSFGTGHHATTFMMIKQMREIDFKDKSVFDFGTGTGILSILAEKIEKEKMRSLLLFLITITALVGCNNLEDARPAKRATFVKLFEGPYDLSASSIELIPGGYVILGNENVIFSDTAYSQTVLIELDEQGNRIG
jgi:hypothetical protein